MLRRTNTPRSPSETLCRNLRALETARKRARQDLWCCCPLILSIMLVAIHSSFPARPLPRCKPCLPLSCARRRSKILKNVRRRMKMLENVQKCSQTLGNDRTKLKTVIIHCSEAKRSEAIKDGRRRSKNNRKRSEMLEACAKMLEDARRHLETIDNTPKRSKTVENDRKCRSKTVEDVRRRLKTFETARR